MSDAAPPSEFPLQWRGSAPAPKRLRAANDSLSADAALRAISEGVGLVWQGDYHQARQLLQALDRRLSRRAAAPAASLLEAFHQQRKQQAERARRLGLLLLRFEPGHRLDLRRAPGGEAAAAALGEATEPYLLPLREFLGMQGAWQWQQQGLALPQLGGARIHPRWGVFAPTRHEYLDLLADAPLPAAPGLLDVGTGSGVVTALLARRGATPLRATELHAPALACAADTFARFRLKVELEAASLFGSTPLSSQGLIVCNPPWLPGKVHSALDAAVYDPDSQMLRGFLAGAAARLAPGGEAWLVMSDLAERLGLRAPAQLQTWMAEGGLRAIARHDTHPRHGRAADTHDPLHAARAAERVSLWRLGIA